jgi:hypothetical protein
MSAVSQNSPAYSYIYILAKYVTVWYSTCVLCTAANWKIQYEIRWAAYQDASLTLSPRALGHIWPRLFIGNFLKKVLKCDLSHTPATSLLNHLYYFIILEISLYGLVWLQLASKAKIYVITKALTIWPSQRSDLVSRDGGMTHNIFYWSRLLPYYPNIVFCYVSQAT